MTNEKIADIKAGHNEPTMAKFSNLIEFRDTRKKAYDSTTQGALLLKIKRIVHKVNTTNDTDREIANFIASSFTINGIVESYNRLGQYGWRNMIMQMAEHEVYERKMEHDRIRQKV